MPEWARDERLAGLEVYRVGGAIRDELLGLAPTEQDFVVVGATPEQMGERGFRPVGRDFPVFLHPDTFEEFALARTERKSGPGYRGFEFHTGPEISLVDDLARRGAQLGYSLTHSSRACAFQTLNAAPLYGNTTLHDRCPKQFRDSPMGGF